MSRTSGPFRLQHPWPFVGMAFVASTLVIGFGFGFLILPRFQGPLGPSSAKEAAYQALGFHVHAKTFNTVQPPVKVPSYIVWTLSTVQQATSGDARRGEFVALNCTACHVEQSQTSEPWIPKLAGLDPLVAYKQLDDYRSGTRLSGPMSAIAQSLTQQDYADVAVYFASRPGLPQDGAQRKLRPDSGYHNSDPIQRLIYAGDPKRGIAACASCHGPGGYLIGAPTLTNQNELYIEQQLQAFAQGGRANDINMAMRTIARMLTPAEMKSLASAYSNGLEGMK